LGVLPLFKTNTYPATEKPMQPPIQKKKVNCLGVKKAKASSIWFVPFPARSVELLLVSCGERSVSLCL